jgi:hypothetical protein
VVGGLLSVIVSKFKLYHHLVVKYVVDELRVVLLRAFDKPDAGNKLTGFGLLHSLEPEVVLAEQALVFLEQFFTVGANDTVIAGLVDAVDEAFKPCEKKERYEHDGRSNQHQRVVAIRYAHAQRRYRPDGGRGGEPVDAVLALEDHACAQEADACNNIGSDAVRIGAADVNGESGEQKRPQAYEDHGAETCGFIPVLAFGPDEPAYEQYKQKPEHQFIQ